MSDLVFNIKDYRKNGELLFYDYIKKQISVIFDVGSRKPNLLKDFKGEVHYFSSDKNVISYLKKELQGTSQKFKLNDFSLGEKTVKRSFLIKDARSYIIDLESDRPESIDLLRINMDGEELNVLKGFGDQIQKVKIIIFNYGPGYIDKDCGLNDIINFLRSKKFVDFAYLSNSGYIPLKKFKNLKIKTNEHILKWQAKCPEEGVVKGFDKEKYSDHYNYCNIICVKR